MKKSLRAAWRVGWTMASFTLVEFVVCGLSAAPVLLAWWPLVEWSAPNGLVRWTVYGFAIVPSYVVFALDLMVVSALATRVTGWWTPANAEVRIADVERPLRNWARYMATIHVVRVLAGSLFRATPIWTAYLRLHGARIGHRVYIGSLALSDYNLLEFGDDVVIGADAHISGHTVEGGLLKTATVRLGNGVTIGLGAVIEIGVEAGPGCQVGALSLVPKRTKLERDTVYVGIPARPKQRAAVVSSM